MRPNPIHSGRGVSRRIFVAGVVAGTLAPRSGWSQDVADILGRIRRPQFPDRDFDIRKHGAVGDGKTDCRAAFADAIAACSASGGGRIVVPAGVYLSNGPIHLASKINLHVAEGATILFGGNPSDYLPTVLVRWESTRCYNYSPLVYAYRQENIAITGKGTLDGQAQLFWGDWKLKQKEDQDSLREMGAKGVLLERRVFGEGHHLRPALCELYDCRDILIDAVTLKGSPFWTIHPVFCANVTVRGVHVLPGTTNDDGCDPESCRDVLIEDCEFDTADDNIAIKAGRDQDAWGDRPCENIIIRRCNAKRSEANAYGIGSEMSGCVRNVFILDSSAGEIAKSVFSIKSNSDRGGSVENVWARGIRAESCDICIQLQTDYKDVVGHAYPPRYRNLHFENVTCRRARKTGISAVGLAARPIDGLCLNGVTVEAAPTEVEIRNARGVETKNVRINGHLLP